jgi:translocation and assembly module TamB
MLLDPKVAEQSSLAYKGEVYADVYGSITGTSTLPDINISVKTAQPSQVEYNHASVQYATDWSDGIIVFQTNDTTDIALFSESESKTAMQLNLAFEDQNLLKLKAVINPLTGDYFEGIGTGMLQVYHSAGGDFQMTGQYTLNEGIFLYKLNKFISRKFVISPGSQIIWSGNPFQPELGLTAYYVIRAQPPRFSEEANENIGHETFLLGIHINGYLDRPTFSFSILFPTGEEGTKYGNSDNPELSAYIESINRDPALVTNQMFSLLTLGKFVGNDDVKNIFGETLNLNTVFAKKLNDLTQDIKFVDIEFNTIDNAQGSAALGLTLRRSLLENRLILRLSSSPFQDNGTGLLQNFSAEYALSPSGKWKLRAFGVPENSQFFQETQTLKSGAGILFTRNFRRFIRKD